MSLVRVGMAAVRHNGLVFRAIIYRYIYIYHTVIPRPQPLPPRLVLSRGRSPCQELRPGNKL